MTRDTKLKELGLEEEAYRLRQQGDGWIQIANTLNSKYHDEIYSKYEKGLSHMAIKRGVIAHEKGRMEKQIQEGVDPIFDIQLRFNEELIRNTNKINKLMDRIYKMIDKAENSENISDMSKAFTVALKGLEQERKSWESFKQNQVRQEVTYNETVQKKEERTQNLIINFSDGLIGILNLDIDQECKEKIKRYIDNLLDNLVRGFK